MQRGLWVGVLVGLVLALSSMPALAVLDAQLIVGNLTLIHYAAWAPNDASRMFVLDRRGRIYIVRNNALEPTPFLDISGETLSDDGEQGLLGLTFDPQFTTNHTFYVYFIKGIPGGGGNGVSTVRRYFVSSNPDLADPGSAYLIFQAAQPQTNHKGANLIFGPDGYLWLGLGDGGTGGWRSQSLLDPMGKMMRFDVSGDDFPADSTRNYRIPPTNPFVGNANALPEIWAYGFRNPYRFSFDRLTGDLWIGDVGQYAWEELDFQPAGDHGGENYGWDFMEGTHCYNPPTNCNDGSLTLPIYDYPHQTQGACYAVTCGAVYRGSALGPRFYGTFFFGDYCDTDLPGYQGRIYSLKYLNGQVQDLTEWSVDLHPPGFQRILFPAAIVEDPAGELYIVDYQGVGGSIWKIIPEPSAVSAPETGATVLRLSPSSPNPSRGAVRWEVTVAETGPVSAVVVDVAGRRIRALPVLARGTATLAWDGKDDAGRGVASGVFFLRVTSGGVTSTRGVTHLR